MRAGSCTAAAAATALLVSGSASADVTWSANVYSRAGENPALAADATSVHLLVVDGGLRYERIDASGAVLTSETVPQSSSATSGFGNGPAVALAADGTVHVAFAVPAGGADTYRGYYAVRSPAGSWSTPIQVQGDTERGYAPAVAVDSQGTAHVGIMAATTTPYGLANHYRVKAGAVDASSTNVGDVRVDDRLVVVAGPSEVAFVMGYPNPSGYIAHSRSTNGGQSFVKGPNLEGSQAGGRIGQPSAAFDSAGTLHVVYGAAQDSSASGQPSVRYATVSSGTPQSDVRVSHDGVLTDWHLTLGIGRIALASSSRVVAYQTKDADADVWVRSSSDGTTWSSPQKIDSGCGSAEGRNTIALAASGDAAWLACPATAGSNVRLSRGVVASGTPSCSPAAPMSVPAFSPTTGSGASQLFEVTYRHCEGASAFRVVTLRIADDAMAATPAVEVTYENGAFHLAGKSCAPGSPATIASALGSLNCATSSVTVSGNDLVAKLSISFDTTSFAGLHAVFADAQGGSATPEPRLGWTELGTFEVTSRQRGSDAGIDGSTGTGGSPGTSGGTTTADDSGCSCRTARSPTDRGAGVGLLAMLLALGLARRRPAAN